MFFKCVDKSGEYNIFCFVTFTNIKFLLLVENQTKEESVSTFFTQAYELLVKAIMNPLYELNTPIKSQQFEYHIKLLIQKYLV